MFEKLLGILHVNGVITHTDNVRNVNLKQLDIDLRAHYGESLPPVTFIDANPRNKKKEDGPVAEPTKIAPTYWANKVAIDKRARLDEGNVEDEFGGVDSPPSEEPKDDPPPEDPTNPDDTPPEEPPSEGK